MRKSTTTPLPWRTSRTSPSPCSSPWTPTAALLWEQNTGRTPHPAHKGVLIRPYRYRVVLDPEPCTSEETDRPEQQQNRDQCEQHPHSNGTIRVNRAVDESSGNSVIEKGNTLDSRVYCQCIQRKWKFCQLIRNLADNKSHPSC